MSVELERELDGKLLVVRANGEMTVEDYRRLRLEIEEEIVRHGKVRFLLEMRNFSIAPSALWEEIKFDAKHFRHVERIAVVGDANWERWTTVLFKPFTAASVRYFDAHELTEARIWIGAVPLGMLEQPMQMNAWM